MTLPQKKKEKRIKRSPSLGMLLEQEEIIDDEEFDVDSELME